MVFQSELIEFVTDKFINGTTLSVEYGESTTVDYSDNSITSTHATITDGTITVNDNQIRVNSVLDTDDGNSNNINATLVSLDSKALNKLLFTTIAKTSDKIIDISETYIVLVDN